MAAERLSVRKIREVLRLSAKGLTHREIGRSLSISHNTAAEYLRRAANAGIDAAMVNGLVGRTWTPTPLWDDRQNLFLEAPYPRTAWNIPPIMRPASLLSQK